ncbi:MAG: ABC transporter substrate-binding protein [Clostridia bacterium]
MFKKFTLSALALVLALSIVGCQTQNDEKIEETTENVVENVVESTETEVLEQEEVATTREITDMIGRTVEIPVDVEKAFCTQPVGAIFVYHVNPEKLLGWNYEPTDDEKVLLLEEYRDLDTFGMGGSTNYEAIIASGADVCIATFETNNDSLLESIETLEQTLGIPVLALDYNLSETENAYAFLGELFSEEEQAEKLVNYTQNLFDSIVEVPESEQKLVYFGNGTDSLETAPIGSASAQEFELLHIANVAYVENSDSSRINVSAEQILQWNPEIMLLNGEPSDDISEDQAVVDMLNDPVYANVTAVQNGEVYGIPKSPFSFISRPTGPNRLMGIQWLKCLVYPEYYDLELEEVTKEFYSLFYHIDLTDEQITDLLY